LRLLSSEGYGIVRRTLQYFNQLTGWNLLTVVNNYSVVALNKGTVAL